jgi:hypothetical protein
MNENYILGVKVLSVVTRLQLLNSETLLQNTGNTNKLRNVNAIR